ncbi:MAG: hypothetical protein QNJ70_00170 [Xenococcaceae cyanobacterium MO_207.B15]|nr:hypothetical protein [Xenococcaceae cyanobacterium MO_207.B15]MDJ0743227.1 hypothetical protein [Xenococcaceae cyanobacterium MO_167.B27]
MNQKPVDMENLDANLHKIALDLWVLAEKNQNDSLLLLSLLRSLEEIHRKIRTEMFEPSLPTTRNKLYQLVKDIEEKGGWPYIERMKLQGLLRNMETEITPDT